MIYFIYYNISMIYILYCITFITIIPIYSSIFIYIVHNGTNNKKISKNIKYPEEFYIVIQTRTLVL